jgi:hypothetical protein
LNTEELTCDSVVSGEMIPVTVEGVVLVMVLPLVYMFPWLVAAGRAHHNRSAIAVLNLLLGWTVLGWVTALVWACTATPRATCVQTLGATGAD